MLRFDLPEQKKLVHETVIPIRWGDMDAMRHVNNTIYFRYMEIARTEWLDTLGRIDGMQTVAPVLLNAFCNFLRQLSYPGDVRASVYVSKIGTSSVDTYYTLERTDEPGVVYATGGSKLVWTLVEEQRSTPIPAAVRERLR
ncbi:MAG: thioesterase family protein [Burkholderiales bacterium]